MDQRIPWLGWRTLHPPIMLMYIVKQGCRWFQGWGVVIIIGDNEILLLLLWSLPFTCAGSQPQAPSKNATLAPNKNKKSTQQCRQQRRHAGTSVVQLSVLSDSPKSSRMAYNLAAVERHCWSEIPGLFHCIPTGLHPEEGGFETFRDLQSPGRQANLKCWSYNT